jgi:hypothetical protein
MSRYARISGVVTGRSLRGFAFAVGDDCLTYFLHMTDFDKGADFQDLKVGDVVSFSSLHLPGNQYRGLAVKVLSKAELVDA